MIKYLRLRAINLSQEFSANLTLLGSTASEELITILTSNAVRWAKNGWGGYIKTESSLEIVNPSMTYEDAQKDMQSLLSFFVLQDVNYTFKTHTSWYEYYSKHLLPPAAHIGQYSGAVASRLMPLNVFDAHARGKFTTELIKLHQKKINLWIMLVAPTAFPHTNTSSLHPTWSSAIWSVRINSKWDQYHNASAEATWDYFNNVHQAMNPLRELTPDMGVSINEADIWEENQEDAFWGHENFQRLLDIKHRVDPDNILTNFGAVGFDKNADRYKCYPEQ